MCILTDNQGRIVMTGIGQALEQSRRVQDARAYLAQEKYGDDFAGLDEHGRPVYRGKTRIPKTKGGRNGTQV